MTIIMGGIAKGKTIKCKCPICRNDFEMIGSNYASHDMLYTEYVKKGVARNTCPECKELIAVDCVDEY
ncbi:hypothetical protein P9294_gp114 [Bacillus phage FADO]|uniref:Uncharacterized protein n=1 Tax=Bacillus phage FADO TaxID=2917160 RepID=A0AAE9GCG7_9CAUD|nr:hypothetical protein P9294_gp114 [Bacillus phage FADO]UNY48829.1 hypothetical protein fado_114 [Bacillus phage FADO]